MKKFFIFLGIAVLAFLVFAMVSQSTPEAKERAALRESIKICRQDAKQTVLLLVVRANCWRKSIARNTVLIRNKSMIRY